MTIAPIRSLAVTLALSVVCMVFTQTQSQAMLVPTTVAQAGQAVHSDADLQTIQKTLESKVLRDKLHALELSDEEIQSRLSRLSDDQKHQLASQIRAVNPAGDGGFVIGVLIIVILVLFIIYLAKRV